MQVETKTSKSIKRKKRSFKERNKALSISQVEFNLISSFANIIYRKFIQYMLNESYNNVYIDLENIRDCDPSDIDNRFCIAIKFCIGPHQIASKWKDRNFEKGIKEFANDNRYLNYSNDNGVIKLENSDLYPYFNIWINTYDEYFYEVKIYSRRKFIVIDTKDDNISEDNSRIRKKKCFLKRLFSKSSE